MLKSKKAKFKQHQAARVLERRKQIAELYLQGKSQWQISKIVQPNVSQVVISKEMKAIREEWLKATVAAFDEAKAKELAKIDHVEEVAWERFWLSCKNAEEKTTYKEKNLKPKKLPKVKNSGGKKLPAQPKEPEGEYEFEMVVTKEKVSKLVKGQVGDPRWIDQVKWAIEMRCKILAIVKPPEVNAQVNVFNIGDVLDSIPVEVPDKAAERIAQVRQALPESVETV